MAMIDPIIPLRLRIEAATRAALGEDAATADPALHRSQHADYQADLAMALGTIGESKGCLERRRTLPDRIRSAPITLAQRT